MQGSTLPTSLIRISTGLFTALVVTGCGMMRPKGLLGIRWGDNAIQAATKVGLVCSEWKAWEGGHGFQVCEANDREVQVYGRAAYLRLVRSGEAIEGIQVTFSACAAQWSALRNAVIRDFVIAADEGEPYTVWTNGEVVRLARDRGDNTCQLTVAGPNFGKAYSQEQLRQGLNELLRLHH